jgi:hypothetical protein
MTKTTTITCDAPGCGADLTSTGPVPKWRLALACERLPHDGDVVYAIALNPPFTGGIRHFCGTECLALWMEEHFSGDTFSARDPQPY